MLRETKRFKGWRASDMGNKPSPFAACKEFKLCISLRQTNPSLSREVSQAELDGLAGKAQTWWAASVVQSITEASN